MYITTYTNRPGTPAINTYIFDPSPAQMRSVGSQGVPRWSKPISHRTGPVPPPTILNVTVTHTILEDKLQEGVQVEVVVNLEWMISGFSNLSDGPGTSQTLPTPIPNTDSSSYGSGSGDFTKFEIELGSLTAIIGYVGEVKLNNFTNPNQDRVVRFKVHMCLFTPVLAVVSP